MKFLPCHFSVKIRMFPLFFTKISSTTSNPILYFELHMSQRYYKQQICVPLWVVPLLCQLELSCSGGVPEVNPAWQLSKICQDAFSRLSKGQGNKTHYLGMHKQVEVKTYKSVYIDNKIVV